MITYRYIPLYYFYWSLYNYGAHAADILTPTTVVQGVDNHSWGLYCRHCYCICVCWGRSSRLFHFPRWLGQLSTVRTKDESTHRLHIYPLGGVDCICAMHQETAFLWSIRYRPNSQSAWWYIVLNALMPEIIAAINKTTCPIKCGMKLLANSQSFDHLSLLGIKLFTLNKIQCM